MARRVCRTLVRELNRKVKNSPEGSRVIDEEWLVRGLARLIAAIVTLSTIRLRILGLVRQRASFTRSPLYSLDSRLDGPCWSTQAERRDGGERSRKLRSSKFDGRVVTLDAFNISEYPVPGFHGTPRHAMPRYAVPPPRQTYIRDLWSRLPWPLLDQINSLRSIF